MTKWSRLKAAVFAATTVMAALQFGGCLDLNLSSDKIIKLATIGNIFD